MSHDIYNISTLDGEEITPAVFANTVPWHGLGTIFDPDGTKGMDSGKAMELATLDGEYTQEGLVSTQDGTEMPGQFGVWFNHKGKNIRWGVGVVGNRYQIVQPSECFNVLDQLLQDGVLQYESAFALQGYRKIVLLARMPQVDTFAEGDKGLRYIAASNSYDGSEVLGFLPTDVRIVCKNTKRMAWAAGKNLLCNIRHTGDMAEKLEQARKYLAQFNKAFDLYRDKAQLLATRRFTPAQAKAYIETLFPTPKKEGRSLENRNNKVMEIRAAYQHPSCQLASIKGTWWGLLNSVTFAADHPKRKFRGTNDRATAENRYLNLMDGPIADLKDQAFDLACEMAGVQTTAA